MFRSGGFARGSELYRLQYHIPAFGNDVNDFRIEG